MSGTQPIGQGEALEERALDGAIRRLSRKADPSCGVSTICDRADLAAVLAALQAHIDHAVAGSLLRPASKCAPVGCHCKEICAAPVIMGRQQPCRRAGGIPGQKAPEALSAPQQPVKQDAVREALEPFANQQTSCALGIRSSDEAEAACAHCDMSTMHCFQVYRARAALATPPLDNTVGLDAGTVEACAKVAERFDIDRSDCSLDDRDIGSLNAGEQQACEGIAAAIRALASGDRS